VVGRGFREEAIVVYFAIGGLLELFDSFDTGSPIAFVILI
jgi:hypothetical protein